jgi:hypothetical protein
MRYLVIWGNRQTARLSLTLCLTSAERRLAGRVPVQSNETRAYWKFIGNRVYGLFSPAEINTYGFI